MTSASSDAAPEALDPEPYRALSREYFETMRDSYTKDKRARVLQTFGFFGIGGLAVNRLIGRHEELQTAVQGQGWMIVVGFAAVGAVAAGLTFLMLRAPALRGGIYALGGLILAAATAAYGGMFGVYPSALLETARLAEVQQSQYFLIAIGLTLASLIFLVPATASILREVPEPTDEIIDERALMLAGQARRASVLKTERENSGAATSGFTRRRRR